MADEQTGLAMLSYADMKMLQQHWGLEQALTAVSWI